jgi:hypothetical protein
VPLAGGPVHTVQVRWQYAEEQEPLDRPRLERLRLDGVPDGPVLWAVDVPAGFRLARSRDDGAEGPAGAVVLDLERARALTDLSVWLAEHRRESSASTAERIVDAQTRFAWYCRRAQGAMLSSPDAAKGPRGEDLAERLRSLQRANKELAEKHEFARERAQAERSLAVPESPLAPLSVRGTPVYWLTGAADPAPAPQLQALAVRQRREALVATGLLLALLLGVWILAHLRRLVSWLRRLWPEQLLLFALVGWQVFGPSLVGMALVLVALGARLLILAVWLPGLLRPQPRAASTNR